MDVAGQAGGPPFSFDLESLVWPLSVKDFVARAMHSDVFFQRGSPQRLSLFEAALGGYDLTYLFAHGEGATVYKEGGRHTTRGSDSDRDVDVLVPGVTVQTHLQNKLPFGRKLIASVARQMDLTSGYFTVFASLDANTTVHFDRNYSFTIQLRGEKTWAVHADYPGIARPSANLADDSEPLIYRLQPGDILYVPPGYRHATECAGLSLSLNLCLEPLGSPRWTECPAATTAE